MKNILLNLSAKKFNMKALQLFLVNYFLLFLINLPNMQFRFSNDAYLRVDNYKMSPVVLNYGRFFAYFTNKVIDFMKFDVIVWQQICWLVYIALLSISIVILFFAMYPYVQKKDTNFYDIIILESILLFSFSNVLIQEFSAFIEGYIIQWGPSLLFASMAVKAFVFADQNKSRIKIILLSFCWLFISVSFYQVAIQLFVTFGLAILIVKNQFKFSKKLCVDVIWLFLVTILATLSNSFILKGLQKLHVVGRESRDISFHKIPDNVILILKYAKENFRWNSSDFIADMAIVCMCLLFVYCVFSISSGQKKVQNIAVVILFSIAGFFSTYGLHMLTAVQWIVPRTMIGLAFIAAALCLFVYLRIKPAYLKTAFICIVIGAFCIHIYYLQSVSINQFASNRLDQEYAQNVAREIQKYQQENDITISKIATCADTDSAWGYYGNIRFIWGDTNLRMIRIDWVDSHLIRYYLGQELTKIEMDPDIYESHFKDKNWDYFIADDQIVFDGDTMYLAIY